MIGWVSPKTTQTGLRNRMRIWRWNTTSVSVSMRAAPGSGGDRRGRGVIVAQRASGEGQEDVVERRAADVDGGGGQRGPLERLQQRRDGGGAVVDGDVQRAGARQHV